MSKPLKYISRTHYSFRFKNDKADIDFLEAIVEELSEKWELGDRSKFVLNLVLEELISNTIFYGFGERKEECFINVDIQLKDLGVEVVIMDNGIAFDPVQQDSEPKSTTLSQMAVGGLGIHLSKNMAKDMVYEYKNGMNHLTLLVPFKE